MRLQRLVPALTFALIVWVLMNYGDTGFARPRVPANSRQDVIVGVVHYAPSAAGKDGYTVVTPQGRHVPIQTRRGETLVGETVRLTVRYINGGPQFRIVGIERLPDSPPPPPPEPEPGTPPEDVQERPDPIVLVRATESRINEALTATRRQIEDKRSLASRTEERIALLPRLDPEVRRDHVEELRDVRHQAVTDIRQRLREMPHQIAGWKEELDGIVLAGNSEAIDIDARARGNLEWLETNGRTVLGDLLERFERMELP